MEELFLKLLWINVYSAVIASPRENDETAAMTANRAIAQYQKAWKGEE